MLSMVNDLQREHERELALAGGVEEISATSTSGLQDVSKKLLAKVQSGLLEISLEGPLSAKMAITRQAKCHTVTIRCATIFIYYFDFLHRPI